jgi:predicted Zn-dependent protease
MRIQLPYLAVVIALVAPLLGSSLFASPQSQEKRSKSDADINAIGHRDIGKGLDFYSLEHEKELGKALAKQVDRSWKFVDDPEIVGYVDRVGQKVAHDSDVRVPVTFRAVDAETVDAFSLPGGYVYINRGLLLRLESEGELAGVLAHGIAHIALRSATKEAAQGEVAQLAMIPAMIFVPSDWSGNGLRITTGMNFMIPLTFLKKEREDILSADYFGLQYVYVTGYDPEGYLNLMERVWPQGTSGKDKLNVFSTSPPLADRIQAMRKEIAEILPKRDGAVVSTPEFKDFQEHVRAWKPGLSESRQPDEKH